MKPLLAGAAALLSAGPPPAGIMQDVQDAIARPTRLVDTVDPTIVGVGALLLVALLATGGRWLTVRHRPPAVEFRTMLERVDEVAVLTHPKPDPDAMASALAVKQIAESVGTRATVQYPGEIRHPENRAFLTVLDIEMEQVSRAADLAADAVVLVDHNEPRGFEGAAEVPPYAVVDHHPGSRGTAVFTDVRTEYGATATILTEYLEVLDADLAAVHPGEETPAGGRLLRGGAPGMALPSGDDPELALGKGLATGLAVGILSDTSSLTRGCSGAEFAAMEYLHPAVDEDLLDRVTNPQVDAGVLEARARAILERKSRPPHVVSDVGAVDNLESIPQAAEELLSLEGITTAMVLGDCDGTLYVSGRSRDDRIHVGRALEGALDDLPGATAGGHARMGGAQLRIGDVDGLRTASGVFQSRESFTRADLHERLFDAMTGDV